MSKRRGVPTGLAWEDAERELRAYHRRPREEADLDAAVLDALCRVLVRGDPARLEGLAADLGCLGRPGRASGRRAGRRADVLVLRLREAAARRRGEWLREQNQCREGREPNNNQGTSTGE